MTKEERKRLDAVLQTMECLFLENLALKLVMEYRNVPNWQELVNGLMEDEEILVGVQLKFQDINKNLERTPDARTALDVLLGRVAKYRKPQ